MKPLVIVLVCLLFAVGVLPHPADVLFAMLPDNHIGTSSDIPLSGVALFIFWPMYYLSGLGLYLSILTFCHAAWLLITEFRHHEPGDHIVTEINKCVGDAETEREYQRGLAEQQARQLGVPKSVH